jgi:hypothetical protein
MTEHWLAVAAPWLFVTNTLLFAALSREAYEAVLLLWAAIGFADGAVPLLD